ncbi:hypothetical protein K7459_13760 [Pseudomonas fluorescens]|uniref:Uncharacterized protein n=1 Tax=Pseudomonas fluorescens (strain Pf0-1) TaxID=205922 RepID=Q3KB10_PSEPF|nr:MULTISPECIES: hypothetical protein [Pseudomonas]ABA75044.1 hypothetical protein Pfl01_3306 [Pseudomonas fluorescens Pf0-1]MBX8620954.1 hypothetical protein [Pseudomonas glycinae]MBY9024734.1 hypothetical protein [Pseudomonas fluorescens]MBY9030751.1 hypothetical protein [Pseudomonas fluorescens]MBY9036754.1 hypothetical protein [Pseudomonas fluorescens]
MKDLIALGFIVSLIGATSAIAAPHASTPVVAAATIGQSGTLNVDTVSVDAEHQGSLKLQQNAEQTKLYIAENRPEFGSKYQRY